METILVLTVGGSHQPILISIEQNRPDFVHFLCSDDSEKAPGSYKQVVDEGMVLRSKPDLQSPDLRNIATVSKLRPDQFQVHRIQELDDIDACYLESHRIIEQVHTSSPQA